MSIFSKKQTSYLGVDIGAHGIKLTELKQSKGRPQLWTYGLAHEATDIHVGVQVKEKTTEDLLIDKNKVGVSASASDGDSTIDKVKASKMEQKVIADTYDVQAKKFGGWLKELIEQSNVTTKMATASLPVSYIFHTLLTLPETDPKELPKIVRAEVKKFLPRPIEEMQVTHQIIPQSDLEKKKKYYKVLVTAAPKFLITFYSKIFQYAGLQLVELETEAFALARAFVGKDKSTAMIVDIGAERTNFFIVDQGFPITQRSLQIGGNNFSEIIDKVLGVEKDMSDQIKNDVSNFGTNQVDVDLFSEPLDAMIKEIQYNFDVFLHQLGNENKRLEKIILTGGSCVIPAIRERLQKEFPMKVFIGDPWARVVYQQKLKPKLDSIGPRLAVTIGLAMRGILE